MYGHFELVLNLTSKHKNEYMKERMQQKKHEMAECLSERMQQAFGGSNGHVRVVMSAQDSHTSISAH